MSLDVPTLFVAIIFIAVMASGLMAMSWLQNRAVTALLWWSAGYLCGAIGTTLLGAREALPVGTSIVVGNFFSLTTAGVLWCGLRVFDGRRAALWYPLVGSTVWLAVSWIDPIYQSMGARASVLTTIYLVYVVLGMCELWRSRDDGLLSRWIALGMLAFHALSMAGRIPLMWREPLPPGMSVAHLSWIPYAMFEAMFFAFGMAFVLLTMTKERAEARHKRAAFIDPLTGVPNRRGLIEQTRAILDRCRLEQRPVTLLLFDLDYFKRINDTFGHQAGDDILVAFCGAAQSRIGPDDIFARIGGEEFACLLPGATPQMAFATAERIRADFDAARFATRAGRVHATVSVGMAHSSDAGSDLTTLFAAADRALYQAKAKGRNRVEGRRPPLTLVPGGMQAPLGAA